MLRATSLARLFRSASHLREISTQTVKYAHLSKSNSNGLSSMQNNNRDHTLVDYRKTSVGTAARLQIGEKIPRREKTEFLINTLLDLEDSKEAVYSTLDTWVAWERDFPIGPLKVVLLRLEKEQQWHRIIQVIKWILSKGQGNTMGTYEQLIRALDMDHRVEEAHMFWKKKIGSDFHSVPWKLCSLMISVYYRNNMLHDLVKLFKGLEAFDRKPQEKSVVQKVANAYEMLGLPDEKERILEKYKEIFTQKDGSKKSRKSTSQNKSSVKKSNRGSHSPERSADSGIAA